MLFMLLISLLILFYIFNTYRNKSVINKEIFRHKLKLTVFFFLISWVVSFLLNQLIYTELNILQLLFMIIPAMFIIFNLFFMLKNRDKNILSTGVFFIILGFFYLFITINIFILEKNIQETVYQAFGLLFFSLIPIGFIAIIINVKDYFKNKDR